MCTDKGRAALAAFVGWAGTQRRDGEDLHLVIAGDIVDFLAEERAGGFQPFTVDPKQADEKLRLILEDTKEVWDALATFVAKGGRLTLLLGNHDLELSLPGPRRRLLDRLGSGRVEFLYDNQAFSLGPLLVEHGNRYDDWNAVPHDDLREFRSQISRGEASEFDPLPGSRMVAEIVNPTKRDLAFVDLLKPETAALLPFLALLSPNRFKQVSATLKNRVRALRVRYGDGRQPKDRNFIANVPDESAVAAFGTGNAADDRLLELAEEAASGGDPNMAADDATSFFDRWKAKFKNAQREAILDLLLRTLRAFRGSTREAFDLACEKEDYLLGATESAAHGFSVIVYGHTHLAKKVSLAGRTASNGRVIENALYLNSGTWADLMAIPECILADDGGQEKDGEEGALDSPAREQLRTFADDLAANRVEHWRRLLPTFVDVSIDGDRALAEVCLLSDGKPINVTTELIMARLQGRAS